MTKAERVSSYRKKLQSDLTNLRTIRSLTVTKHFTRTDKQRLLRDAVRNVRVWRELIEHAKGGA